LPLQLVAIPDHDVAVCLDPPLQVRFPGRHVLRSTRHPLVARRLLINCLISRESQLSRVVCTRHVTHPMAAAMGATARLAGNNDSLHFARGQCARSKAGAGVLNSARDVRDQSIAPPPMRRPRYIDSGSSAAVGSGITSRECVCSARKSSVGLRLT
jgi:hypothetical protein